MISPRAPSTTVVELLRAALRTVAADALGERSGRQQAASLLDLFGKNLLRDMPVDNDRYPQQNHERWIPRRIKQIAGNQQIGFFCFPAERRVVQHQDEKHDKRQ